ncbi:glycoside hydrolase family 3 C-terminal domain-containing protein [Lactobacillus sp. R2/2]|nr:glycoside hydrolase family 3 C-terminal domain-containing protein [Lactobacillus sp. R2/2]
MKNKNSILPLNKNYKVALIGDFAKNPRYQGSGSSLVNSKNVESLFSTAKTILLK